MQMYSAKSSRLWRVFCPVNNSRYIGMSGNFSLTTCYCTYPCVNWNIFAQGGRAAKWLPLFSRKIKWDIATWSCFLPATHRVALTFREIVLLNLRVTTVLPVCDSELLQKRSMQTKIILGMVKLGTVSAKETSARVYEIAYYWVFFKAC
jgi:hypothetical protein